MDSENAVGATNASHLPASPNSSHMTSRASSNVETNYGTIPTVKTSNGGETETASHCSTSEVFECPTVGCSKRFRTAGERTIHLSRKTFVDIPQDGQAGLKRTWVFACPESSCQKLYMREESLVQHLKRRYVLLCGCEPERAYFEFAS